MANNRLEIYDPVTGWRFMIGKSMGDGWYVSHSSPQEFVDRLNAFYQRVHEGNGEEIGDAASYGISLEPTRLILRTENSAPPD